MKRVLMSVLALLLVATFMFSACEQSGSVEESVSAEPSSAVSSEVESVPEESSEDFSEDASDDETYG